MYVRACVCVCVCKRRYAHTYTHTNRRTVQNPTHNYAFSKPARGYMSIVKALSLNRHSASFRYSTRVSPTVLLSSPNITLYFILNFASESLIRAYPLNAFLNCLVIRIPLNLNKFRWATYVRYSSFYETQGITAVLTTTYWTTRIHPMPSPLCLRLFLILYPIYTQVFPSGFPTKIW